MKHRALSVRAPAAWLIRTGRKRIELRSKPTTHRGPLLICAGMRTLEREALVSADELQAALAAPRGCALCIVDVIDCRPATPDDASAACFAPEPGSWAWVLANPRPVATSAVSGVLGLFWAEIACPLCGDDATRREAQCYQCGQWGEIGNAPAPAPAAEPSDGSELYRGWRLDRY